MCVVSMVGYHYADKWRGLPWIEPVVPQWPWTGDEGTRADSPISRSEFDALKREVEEMKALLKRAKDYDERNNEPDCEIDEKMDFLRRVAKLDVVDLDDVLKPAAT